ncbi:MAG: hypothetical protein ACI4RT_06635 [Candidatus Spyradenecus sp.]
MGEAVEGVEFPLAGGGVGFGAFPGAEEEATGFGVAAEAVGMKSEAIAKELCQNDALGEGILEAVGWQGARKGRRMVALKSSPIWEALGNGAGGFRDTLGNPYPPFAYGSSYEWSELSRAEAQALGLLKAVENSAAHPQDTAGHWAAKEGESCTHTPAKKAPDEENGATKRP